MQKQYACSITSYTVLTFYHNAGTGVTTYSLHPGAVHTELQRHQSLLDFMRGPTSILWKDPVHGAQTSICCAVSEEFENDSGKFYRY